ncbi:MAG: hypothetical protein R3293_08175 [Candidatus Promineifilaceae bacterium]|nr:hypothetical protein [Candidatus Promineifilaceae bacterium]
MILQAAEGDFISNPILIFVILLVIVVAVSYWYKTHCPNCKRVFTREMIQKEKAGRLPTVISNRERRHYRCKNCGHEWDKVHDVN